MAYVRQNPQFPKYRMKVGVMPDFSGANTVEQEKPAGLLDGTNRLFTIEHRPIKGSFKLYKDGMRMTRASAMNMTDGDYFLDYENRTITFAENQVPTDRHVIRVEYKYMG